MIKLTEQFFEEVYKVSLLQEETGEKYANAIKVVFPSGTNHNYSDTQMHNFRTQPFVYTAACMLQHTAATSFQKQIQPETYWRRWSLPIRGASRPEQNTIFQSAAPTPAPESRFR